MNIKAKCGGRELLNLVQPLWEKLNQHHYNQSNYFKDVFRGKTFEDRIEKFRISKGFDLNVVLIQDTDTEEYVGYCVATIDKELVGEIDSIYIEEEYRRESIGEFLMESTLVWFRSNNIQTSTITVAEGNEEVLEFYKKFGYYKRKIILEKRE